MADPPNGCKYLTLREFEARMDFQDRRHESERRSDATAVKLAQVALSDRLEHMNEFREQILTERADFLLRREVTPRLDRIERGLAWIWGALAALWLASTIAMFVVTMVLR